VGGVTRQEQPTLTEPRGQPELEVVPRGPRQAGDPCVQAGIVDKGLEVVHGDGRAGLAVHQLLTTYPSGNQQPPPRMFTEREEQRQPLSTGTDVRGSILEIGRELNVREDDLLLVWSATPGNPGSTSHGAAWAVAPDHIRKRGRLHPRPRPERGVCCRSLIPHSKQFRSPFHGDPACRERLREYGFNIHLAHEGEVGEGRVREVQLIEADPDHPMAQVEIDVRGGVSARQDRIANAQGTEDFQRAGMQDQGAGRAKRLGAPVDDADMRAIGMGL
jgi:hypothetical protein